jgi:hypothetical protein
MNSEDPVRCGTRKRIFITSIAASVLGAIGCAICWAAPFPLVPWGEGGYAVSPWDDRVLVASVVLLMLGIALSLFGRGIPRLFLIAIDIVLIALSILGYVGNHV